MYKKNWRKEFEERHKIHKMTAYDDYTFGDGNFNTDAEVITLLTKLEKMGATIKIDDDFFCSVNVGLPKESKKREAIFWFVNQCEPRPSEITKENKNTIGLVWS
jgi:hypothetical protein